MKQGKRTRTDRDCRTRFWLRTRCWLLALCALLAGCGRKVDVRAVHDQALDALRQGNLPLAQQRMNDAFGERRIDPEHAGEELFAAPFSDSDPLARAGATPAQQAALWLLESEILLARGKAPDAGKLIDRIPEPEGDAELRLRWLADCADVLNKTERRDAAAEMLDRVEAAVRESPTLASSMWALKARLIRGNQLPPEEANRWQRETAELAERAGDLFSKASAELNLINSLTVQRRYDQAVLFGLRALESAERVGAHKTAALMHNNLGIAYFWLGDMEQAERHIQFAIEETRKIGDDRNLSDALGEIANVYVSTGQMNKAFQALEEALATAQRIDDRYREFLWTGNLAAAHIRAGEWNEAERWNRSGYELNAASSQPRPTSLLQLNDADIARGRGNSEEAQRLYQTAAQQTGVPFIAWEAHAGLGRLYASERRFDQANREYEQTLAIIERERTALDGEDFRFSFHDEMMNFFEDYVDLLVTEGREEQALEVAEFSRARVLAEHLGEAATSVEQVRASAFETYAKRSGEVLLSYWLAPKRSFLWVVDTHGVKLHVLAGRAEVARAVEVYRRMIERDMRDPVALELPQAAELSRLLLGPASAELRGAGHVTVVPDKELTTLNLETLAGPEQNRYWIEDVELAIAPSLIVLSQGGVAGPVRAGGLLVFGAPGAHLPEYPELAAAKAEIQNIENLFGRARQALDVRTGADATPRAFLDAMPGKFSMIHFAAHAEANPQSPLDSAVILSGDRDNYKLYARDIAALRLNADLVTISACRSAGARTYAGEGLVGFAWAFLGSGARSVVAGLWDVGDEASSRLMTHLYQQLAKGVRPRSALRAAKLEMLKGGGSRAKPYFWGPFQTYLR